MAFEDLKAQFDVPVYDMDAEQFSGFFPAPIIKKSQKRRIAF
jgi:hypothetical protein